MIAASTVADAPEPLQQPLAFLRIGVAADEAALDTRFGQRPAHTLAVANAGRENQHGVAVGSPFHDLPADVRLYARALGAAEIQTLVDRGEP